MKPEELLEITKIFNNTLYKYRRYRQQENELSEYLQQQNNDLVFFLYNLLCNDNMSLNQIPDDVTKKVIISLWRINLNIYAKITKKEKKKIFYALTEKEDIKQIIIELRKKYESYLQCWKIFITPNHDIVNMCKLNIERLPNIILQDLIMNRLVNTFPDIKKEGYSELLIQLKNIVDKFSPIENFSYYPIEYFVYKFSLTYTEQTKLISFLNKNYIKTCENVFEEFGLSLRIQNALFGKNITNFEQLMGINLDTFVIRSVGVVGKKEIKEAIDKYVDRNNNKN